jgi:hypothetical protein
VQALPNNIPIFFSAPNDTKSARQLRELNCTAIQRAAHTANSRTSSSGVNPIAPPTSSPNMHVEEFEFLLIESLCDSLRYLIALYR